VKVSIDGEVPLLNGATTADVVSAWAAMVGEEAAIGTTVVEAAVSAMEVVVSKRLESSLKME